MAFITKKRKVANTKVDKNKSYSLKRSICIGERSKYLQSLMHLLICISVLGVDPKKADQAIRGTVTLPHGTGKTKRVLVLCAPDKEAEAKAAGADFVGLDEFVTED